MNLRQVRGGSGASMLALVRDLFRKAMRLCKIWEDGGGRIRRDAEAAFDVDLCEFM